MTLKLVPLYVSTVTVVGTDSRVINVTTTTATTMNCSANNQTSTNYSQYNSPNNSVMKTYTIHCLIESSQLRSDVTLTPAAHTSRDTYVIIPANALFGDLVPMAVCKSGLSTVDALAAKGYLELKNWKRLPVELITDDQQATVEDVLGDIVAIATLFIRLNTSNKRQLLSDVKEKMLTFLLQHSTSLLSTYQQVVGLSKSQMFTCQHCQQDTTSLLSTSGCPLQQAQLAELTGTDLYSCESLAENQLQAFISWYSELTDNNSSRLEHTSSTDSKPLLTYNNTNDDSHRCHSISPPSPIFHRAHGNTDTSAVTSQEAPPTASDNTLATNETTLRRWFLHSVTNNTLDTPPARPLTLTERGEGWSHNESVGELCNGRDSTSHSRSNSPATSCCHDDDVTSRNGDHDVIDVKIDNDEYEKCQHVDVISDRSQHQRRHRVRHQHRHHCQQRQHHHSDSGRDRSRSRSQSKTRSSQGHRINVDMDQFMDDLEHKQQLWRTLNSEHKDDVIALQRQQRMTSSDDDRCRSLRHSPPLLYQRSSRHDVTSAAQRSRLEPEGIVDVMSRGAYYLTSSPSFSLADCQPNVSMAPPAPPQDLDHLAPLLTPLTTRVLPRPCIASPPGQCSVSPHTHSIVSPPQDLMRQLREQQAMRLAAVSRALHQQLRYLHHLNKLPVVDTCYLHHSGSSPAVLYNSHRQSFDARVMLASAGAAAGLHGCDGLPPVYATELAMASGRTSPADSETSNDNNSGGGLGSLDRRKRSRVFIDPLTEIPRHHRVNHRERERVNIEKKPETEIPRLERWFADDTHPSAYTIEQYTEELNRAPYRQRFPPLEPKNVQLWFKNHRAKVKRQKLEMHSTNSAIISGTTVVCNER